MKYNRRNNKEEHRQMRAPVYEALETLKEKESFHLMCRDIKEAEEIRNW